MEVPARSSGNNIDWPNEDFFGKIPTNQVNLGEKFGSFMMYIMTQSQFDHFYYSILHPVC